jgi:hypothetical protein
MNKEKNHGHKGLRAISWKPAKRCEPMSNRGWAAVADKYFSKSLSAQATFGRAPHDRFSCDIIVHVMQGLILKGRGEAADARTSFDGASDKDRKAAAPLYASPCRTATEQTAHALAAGRGGVHRFRCR